MRPLRTSLLAATTLLFVVIAGLVSPYGAAADAGSHHTDCSVNVGSATHAVVVGAPVSLAVAAVTMLVYDVGATRAVDDAGLLSVSPGCRLATRATPEVSTARTGATGSVDDLLSDVNVSGPYTRPLPGTTASQWASVQGQACYTCGAADDVMRADHFDPYYERYLRGDTTMAGALDDAAVGPQCMVCSARQGASYSQVSRAFNRSIENMFRWMSGG